MYLQWLVGIYICYVYIYIYSTNRFAGHGKEKVLKLLFGFGENVKPVADALKQTLKAITYFSAASALSCGTF